ncbi:MAG: hypothetical protein LBC10_01890, partial [Deltaproteobacteria bacterium]|nr:hypothetical protein [Deltaproteobacteria bacterium]
MGHRLMRIRRVAFTLCTVRVRLAAKLLLASLAFTLATAFWCTTAQAALFNFGIKDEQELGREFEVLIRSR